MYKEVYMKQLPPLPDFDHCLVNLANSILKHFGAKPTAPTLSMADEVLAEDRRNVVILLLDGMGIYDIDLLLEPDGFFRSHLLGQYSSVFPPTTVAATTSIDTGLFPCEHSWLGWDCFFPELKKNVTVYLNRDQMSELPLPPKSGEEFPPLAEQLPAADFHVAGKYCPYTSVVTKINDAGGKAYYSSPYADPFPQDLDTILARITEHCKKTEKKYIYAYWNEPDGCMHKTGVDSSETKATILEIEKKVQAFAESLPEDTLLFITADHGHINNERLCILDYPEIMKCLERLPSIEPRALNLFVKDEYKEIFPVLFEKTFGDKFCLLPKTEVIGKGVFGKGNEHAVFRDMLGDYLAISIAEVSLYNTHIEAAKMIGAHAGLTKEEWEIPLIVVKK